jgi:hypothetical protein
MLEEVSNCLTWMLKSRMKIHHDRQYGVENSGSAKNRSVPPLLKD